MEKKEIVMIGDAIIYAPFSTLIGVIVFIGCMSAFGGWGLISLIFILPFIKHGINQQKFNDEIKK